MVTSEQNPYRIDKPIPNGDGIQCKICDHGTLERCTGFRYGTALGILGMLIGIGGILSILALLFFWGSAFWFAYSANNPDAGTGAVILGGFMLPLFFALLVPTFIGLFLMRRRRVLQCPNCGAVVEAS